jgi:hypothetical protein
MLGVKRAETCRQGQGQGQPDVCQHSIRRVTAAQPARLSRAGNPAPLASPCPARCSARRNLLTIPQSASLTARPLPPYDYSRSSTPRPYHTLFRPAPSLPHSPTSSSRFHHRTPAEPMLTSPHLLYCHVSPVSPPLCNNAKATSLSEPESGSFSAAPRGGSSLHIFLGNPAAENAVHEPGAYHEKKSRPPQEHPRATVLSEKTIAEDAGIHFLRANNLPSCRITPPRRRSLSRQLFCSPHPCLSPRRYPQIPL